jgi:ubiquinone biosynthesis protein COQ4
VLFGTEPPTSKLRGPCSSHQDRKAGASFRLRATELSRSPERRCAPIQQLPCLQSLNTLDLIAAFGEATAQPYFIYKLRDRMLLHPTGRRILRDRPRLTSTSLDIPHLRSLPSNTVGYTYAAWLDAEGVSPDTRAAVRYIDDEECAYVMQRYRECHDFYHALVGLPVFREGEVALKAFEFANTGLPMTGLAVFSAFTLKTAEWRRFWDVYGPWAVRNGAQSDDVINVYWEEELETDVDELRARLGIEKPPDLRSMRKAIREAKRKDKEAREAAAGAVM